MPTQIREAEIADILRCHDDIRFRHPSFILSWKCTSEEIRVAEYIYAETRYRGSDGFAMLQKETIDLLVEIPWSGATEEQTNKLTIIQQVTYIKTKWKLAKVAAVAYYRGESQATYDSATYLVGLHQ